MGRYEEIEAFVSTVDTGSFTGAARHLRLAKSAISRRVSDLEARLGVQLMLRTTRALSLTDAGRALYQTSSQLLSDWREAEAAISDATSALQGHLRIGAPLSFGVTYLGPVILTFLKIHPDIAFDIDFSDRRIDLISEGVDVAIRIGQLQDSTLLARKICTVKTIAAASPAYLSAHGMPQVPADLKSHRQLRYGYSDKDGWLFKGPGGETGTADVPERLRATNGDFLRDAALASEGIVLLPAFFISDDLRAGRLKRVLANYDWPVLGIYAVYPPTRHMSARVRAFIEHVTDSFSKTPLWE